ncbi:MAG: hypothetical protein PHX24_11750 [Acidithiobacillus sp.]|nr:hypothetical protein [Acidithiobacillus sp.]
MTTVTTEYHLKRIGLGDILNGLGNAGPEDLEKVLQNAKVKIVFEFNADGANTNTGAGAAHTDGEIMAMFPDALDNNPSAQYFLDRMLRGYKALCFALQKGGYSVSDKNVAMILTQADVMENVPRWAGISDTQEGGALDVFLSEIRATTDAGFRVSEDGLKSCFGPLSVRLMQRQ